MFTAFVMVAGHLLFHLIRKRHEKGSQLLTSNQPIGSWGEMLANEVVATAILNSLLHHSHIVTIKGESYRLCQASKETNPRIASHNFLPKSPGCLIRGHTLDETCWAVASPNYNLRGIGEWTSH